MTLTRFVRRAYSLRLALILQVLVPLALLLAAATWVGMKALESSLEERLEEDVQLIARAIRLPVSHSLEREEEEAVRQALESVFTIGRVYGAYVYDRRGEQVAAVGAVKPSAAERNRLQALAEEGRDTGEYELIEGRQVYSYFIPLVDTGGRISGLLQVTRRQSDFADYVSGIQRQAGLAALLTTLIIGALVLVGHRTAIGRHMAQLSHSMAQVEAGNRGHRAREQGPRELRQLSGAYNQMLDSIQRAEQELLERQRREAELERALASSKRLAALGRLSAGVAHELGTPLSVIDGQSQRGLRDPDLSPPASKAFRRIRSEVDRMSQIVQQLLDFGRPSNGEWRMLTVRDLVQRVAHTQMESDRARGARIDWVPPAEDGLMVRGHPMRLEQALTNLVQNAIHAANGGCVRIRWGRVGDRVALWVEDDGPGVPEGDRARLFEPFFTTKPVGEGTGLGLAVVHGIAQEHGGDVRLLPDSELGGACFRLSLPAADEQQKDEGSS
ncbi:ATP-binding protein [Alkalilimnicola ehrlichii MLHE-1]|uniref:histidine kinase n=1 Tax=Alkalilimnicola ehrlichii (strain ATCC BAA-1101 / DSM 17681 / MLHE-1) TaxID=187272 RepID=Q0A8W2_ALKEH|nr:HAMP domain-containing sensor histidine kinase [Alkalilimnicola ehrlichii]ABI56725.1 periplasmic sensor signal transduction histidine kinase [Alkalilimnicola ehrlichii MLHE-1]